MNTEVLRRVGRFCMESLFPSTESEAAAREADYESLARYFDPQPVRTLERAVALFPYRQPLVRQAIWELKYRTNKHLAGLFAQSLADWLLESADDEFPDGREVLFVPMPTTRARVRERGKNQTELVADILFRKHNMPMRYVTDLLVRTDNAQSQTRAKSKKERLQAFKGVFEVRAPERFKNARIILFDDVITTGATLERAREALHAAGFTDVEGLALAR